MSTNTLLTIAAVFFLAVLALVLLLLVRRLLMGPYYRWRLQKFKDWGRALDKIVARLDEPSPAELASLKFAGAFKRQILEEVLLDRLDLMAGKSRMPLVHVFEQTGLQNLTLVELQSRNVWHRRRAADRLGRAASREIAVHLTQALDDPDADVRAIAAKSLGKLGVQAAAPRMISLLPGLKEDVSNIIADTLIEMGASMLAPLTSALDHESENSRYFAALCVANICEAGRCEVRVMKALPRRRATDLPAVFPPDLITKMRPLTQDGSPRLRGAAAIALAVLNDYQSTPRLEEMLRSDADAGVRTAAAKALGIMGSEEAARTLIDALGDPEWNVCREAARSLAAIGAPHIEQLNLPWFRTSRAHEWLSEIQELAAESSP